MMKEERTSWLHSTAGKVWHAPKFQELRDEIGMPVQARWIDLDNDSDFVRNKKNELWRLCFEDVRDSDFVLFYAEDFEEEQRGALVEIGMAYGFQKPVYAVGLVKLLHRMRFRMSLLHISRTGIGYQQTICSKVLTWHSKSSVRKSNSCKNWRLHND